MRRVLLLHGLGSDPRSWDAVRPLLPPDCAVDAPAHPADFDDAVAAAAAWMARGPGVVCGHSMGGHVTLVAAHVAATDHHRLVLLAPGGVGPAPPPALVEAAFTRDALCAMDGDTLEALSRSRFADPTHPAAERLVAERLDMLGTHAMHTWATQVERHTRGVVKRWLGDATDTPGRLDVVHGAKDTMVPRAPLAALADAHPRARFHGWDDCGHILPLEAPERVAALIMASAQWGVR